MLPAPPPMVTVGAPHTVGEVVPVPIQMYGPPPGEDVVVPLPPLGVLEPLDGEMVGGSTLRVAVPFWGVGVGEELRVEEGEEEVVGELVPAPPPPPGEPVGVRVPPIPPPMDGELEGVEEVEVV